MRPEVPDQLLESAEEWHDLHRWERRELGRALRQRGLTYSEIRRIIPVPKATLSNWCHGIRLTPSQVAAIKERVPSQKGIPKDSQWRRRREVDEIRRQAAVYARGHVGDAEFVAGVVLYWAEGSKTRNDVLLSNTDPRTLRLFIRWVRQHLDDEAEFVLSLHLHEGNDEAEAIAYWRTATGLVEARFTKTFVKPMGSGHRKNSHRHGVCRVRVLRSSDHWNRIMAWIDVIADRLSV